MSVAIANSKREKTRISAQFRSFRKRHLLSQDALAELMGVTSRTVQNVEAGATGATASMLLKFRDAQRSVKAGGLKAKSDLRRMPR